MRIAAVVKESRKHPGRMATQMRACSSMTRIFTLGISTG